MLQPDNILATPRMGAHTHEALERMDRICAETVVVILQGKPCPNVLNFTVLTSFKT